MGKIGGDVPFSEEVHQFVDSILHIGLKQYDDFRTQRLVDGSKKVSDPVLTNKFLHQANNICLLPKSQLLNFHPDSTQNEICRHV